MIRHSETVLENERISESYFRIVFSWNGPPPLPAQFFTVRICDGSTPLLRRPLAFSAYYDGKAEAVYEIRGDGTRLLSENAVGVSIDLLGPLGNPFPPPPAGKRPVIIGGGVGLGPVAYLMNSWSNLNPIFIAGFRTMGQVPLGYLPQGCVVTTDDGSHGFSGNPVTYLETIDTPEALEFYVCGPDPLMSGVTAFAQGRGETCWVSVEQIMACAVGACAGCVISTKQGFKRVCKDGPVFHGEEILWT